MPLLVSSGLKSLCNSVKAHVRCVCTLLLVFAFKNSVPMNDCVTLFSLMPSRLIGMERLSPTSRITSCVFSPSSSAHPSSSPFSTLHYGDRNDFYDKSFAGQHRTPFANLANQSGSLNSPARSVPILCSQHLLPNDINPKQQDFSGRNQQCTASGVRSFMSQAKQFLESNSCVEEYMWFGAFTDMGNVNPDNRLVNDDLSLDSLGELYVHGV
jgi:hypothetical protein